jgi:hypothetical protein
MKRKLVKQGAATLMISLPSKWLKSNHLDKGADVDLEEIDENLVISATKVGIKKEAEIKLSDLTESSIRTLITNTYRKGYDKITVFFDNEKQFQILDNVIRTVLLGFDIVKKEKNKCFVENITEPSSDQFENILNKVFLNISTLFEITNNRFNKGKPEENFEDVEQRIMQYDNFCRRVISKGLLVHEKKEFFWAFLHLVDHGQREIYHLNKVLGGFAISEKSKELLKGSEKMFELIKKAYLEKNLQVLSEVHSLEKELIYKKGYALLEKSKGKENIIIYHLIASIRKFFQTNSPLTALII